MKSKKGLIITLILVILLAAGTFIVLGINKNDGSNTAGNSGDTYVIVSESAEKLSSVEVNAPELDIKAVNNGTSTDNDLRRALRRVNEVENSDHLEKQV